MTYTHAPYISPYGPPEESGIRPPQGWNEEPTTETPHENTFYPPVDPQLSYPHHLQLSGFQPYNSQATGSHSTGAPVLDYQTLPPNPFSPQLQTHQPSIFSPQYNDPGSSSAYAYRSSTLPNPFSSLEVSSGTENHDADLQLTYPLVEQNVNTWLQNDGDLGNWTYDGQHHGEQSSYHPDNQQFAPYIDLSELQESYANEPQGLQGFDNSYNTDQYSAQGVHSALKIPPAAIEYRRWGKRGNAPLKVYCINCRALLPTFGIRCEDCQQRRQNDAHALQLEFCLLCTADVNDPGNLMCPDHMSTRQAFNDNEKAVLRENHICNQCYKRDAGSLLRCGSCYEQANNPRRRFRRLGLCRCGKEAMPGHGQCEGCADASRARQRRIRER
ncbi:uncharacterized protein FFUJ_14603 [Fusarium fujikuroi IMI 58289]|uniref:Uncharacterized protein n=2 Tax=Fusarium fujikuroi TaxID=5127 RepID=S0E5S4_GIBF5|nr:uncharacterized protein FFUJ_14603 [Fusarium fujikuroi IMI 58289]SCN93799.1 uncharacterized protein FFE2_07860 [Fusarium fujikuroi]CCT67938.1 uncharacterized protein FFUJ_14603 [Fusarium fujikuroi IMI 58289]SCO21716.1 uncharacterized protein FFM5_12736 [Fusarium fujikuroi]SCO41685.1 uncharacterized protein FFNC_08085 [Fusarium fujikuroi]SCO41973.1 uncharacterized protein FFMR_06605 [Fusarium fujikuroi]